MNRRVLRFALEGEQTMMAPLVAMPVGEGHLIALDEMDSDIEAVRTHGEALENTGAFERVKLSSEKMKIAVEGIKEVLDKIWKIIAKILAACTALIEGLLRWLIGGNKHRSLTKSIVKAYQESEYRYLNLFKDLHIGGLLEPTIKADNLSDIHTSEMPTIQLATLGDTAKLEKAVTILTTALGDRKLGQDLKTTGDLLGSIYKQFAVKAAAVDSIGEKFDGTGVDKEYTAALTTFMDEVDSKFGSVSSVDSKDIELLNDGLHLLKDAHTVRCAYKLPTDLGETTGMGLRSALFESAGRYEDEYAKILQSVSKSVEDAESRFSGTAAAGTYQSIAIDHAANKNGLAGKQAAQVYLDKAVLLAVRAFGRSTQIIAKSFAALESLFIATIESNVRLWDYAIVAGQHYLHDHPEYRHGPKSVGEWVKNAQALRAESQLALQRAGYARRWSKAHVL